MIRVPVGVLVVLFQLGMLAGIGILHLEGMVK